MPKRQDSKRALFYSALLFWGVSFVSPAKTDEQTSTACEAPPFDETAIVENVYDGDTIKLRDSRVVRFIGINTTELERDRIPAQPLAFEAKTALLKKIPAGTVVGLKYDRATKDSHKRVLAHVYTQSGGNLSAELIEQGLGFAIVIPPNTAYSDCYFAREQQARGAKRGIWSHPAYQVKAVATLAKSDTGFQYIQGRVTSVGQGKKNIWLDMGTGFSVRIQRKHLQYFSDTPIEVMKGKQLRLRGWVAYYNGKLRINIGHPAMMEIVE